MSSSLTPSLLKGPVIHCHLSLALDKQGGTKDDTTEKTLHTPLPLRVYKGRRS